MAGLGCGGGIVAHPAAADNVTVAVNPGGIAFGYADGYWDRERNWHAWRDAREAEAWRREHREHYYEWRHDRDEDHGWRDRDRWWDRR